MISIGGDKERAYNEKHGCDKLRDGEALEVINFEY